MYVLQHFNNPVNKPLKKIREKSLKNLFSANRTSSTCVLTGFYLLVWGGGSFRLNLGLLLSLGSEYLLDSKTPIGSGVYLGFSMI